jgi:uncharacterized protein YdeI (YjbR/CyaY-like superfamily)
MVRTENFRTVTVTSSNDLREWLKSNHGQEDSVWLVTFKKVVPDSYVSVEEVLDELLCFGWIDGIRRKLDDTRTMQLISPRKTQHWSKSYKERVLKLEKNGKMEKPGRKVIAESKRLGLWDFMDDVDALIIPEDFMLALNLYEEALKNFSSFGDSSKRFTLRWIKLSKTAATRQKRILQAAELADKNKKIPGL